jgi:flavin-dependent dehydrogenase
LPSDIDVDVGIVGAGPAGSAAALALRRYTSLRVALFERSHFGDPRPGEYLTAQIAPLLDYLGVDADFLTREHLPAGQPLAAWGSAELAPSRSLFPDAGHGWRVDRRRLDAALAREAERLGADIYDNSAVRSVTYDGAAQRWIASFEDASGRRRCRARYIVDASGPGARIARKLGASFVTDDALYAVVARYDGGPSGLPSLVVESTRDGWWYAVEVPGGQLVVTFVTDVSGMRRTRPAFAAGWHTLARSTHHVAALVERRSPLSLDGVFLPSRRLSSAAGPRWIAVGDAALASDPIASLGIGFAVNSGANGARALDAELRGQPAAALTYARRVAETFDDYRVMRRGVYAMESRWPDATFWAQRATAVRPS